ncbi:hypothetical protein HDV64DRAFT_239332 [Trichoderma sp. TUCIM 5745]
MPAGHPSRAGTRSMHEISPFFLLLVATIFAPQLRTGTGLDIFFQLLLRFIGETKRLRALQNSSQRIFSEASASRDPSKRISNQTRVRCDESTNPEVERNSRTNRPAWNKPHK